MARQVDEPSPCLCLCRLMRFDNCIGIETIERHGLSARICEGKGRNELIRWRECSIDTRHDCQTSVHSHKAKSTTRTFSIQLPRAQGTVDRRRGGTIQYYATRTECRRFTNSGIVDPSLRGSWRMAHIWVPRCQLRTIREWLFKAIVFPLNGHCHCY